MQDSMGWPCTLRLDAASQKDAGLEAPICARVSPLDLGNAVAVVSVSTYTAQWALPRSQAH